MIRVLSIASYQFLPAIMGGQKGIALFNRYLSKQVSLTCATIPVNVANSHETYELIPVLSSSKLRYINPFYFFSLKKIIRAQKITHVLLEHPYYGWLGYLLKRLLNIKLVVHSHNIEALRFKDFGKWWWKLMWHYERNVHRMADLSFFISDEDRTYATAHFDLDQNKTTVITYGILQNEACPQQEKQLARKKVCSLHHISENKLLLLYSGTLYYGPNLTALDAILHEINPILKNDGLEYAIIICGSHLPERYQNLDAYKNQNIIYAGFVENIDMYFQAADIFLNPISEGGGIKTKLVEALAGNTSAVSFKSGAYGVPVAVTGKKLSIVPDNDAPAFAGAIKKSREAITEDIPADFFQHFYWGNIAAKAAGKMQSLS